MHYTFEFLIALLCLSVVFVEGATELLCKSLFFSPLRWLFSKVSFLRALISCGYCTSVWVAALPAWALTLLFDFSSLWEQAALIVFLTVVVHRMANYLHCFGDKHLDKYYDPRFKSEE